MEIGGDKQRWLFSNSLDKLYLERKAKEVHFVVSGSGKEKRRDGSGEFPVLYGTLLVDGVDEGTHKVSVSSLQSEKPHNVKPGDMLLVRGTGTGMVRFSVVPPAAKTEQVI